MKPLKLILENIHSFRGVHEVDFSGINLAVLSGQNGAGKSTLAYDAPMFALFGETRGPLDSIIAEGEQFCRVEFTFALGEETYLISRSRSSKGNGSSLLSFQLLGADGQPVLLDGKSIAETQTKIEQVLHMDSALLQMTAFSKQGDADAFSRAKPAERKEVLGKILSLQDWEERATTARAMSKEILSQTEVKQNLLNQAQERADKAEFIQVEINTAELEIEKRNDRIRLGENQLAESQAEREKLLAEQAADEANRRELQGLQQSLQAQNAKVAEARQRVGVMERSLGLIETAKAAVQDATGANAEVFRLEEVGKKYTDFDRQIELLNGELTSLGREHENQKWTLETYTKNARQNRAAAIEKAQQEIASSKALHSQKIIGLEQRLNHLREQSKPLDSVPCATIPDLVGGCPLIANAKAAKERISQVEVELKRLNSTEPWETEEIALHRLLAENNEKLEQESTALLSFPAESPEMIGTKEKITAVEEAQIALGWNQQLFADHKAKAQQLPSLQADLARLEQIAFQLEDAKKSLAGLEAEEKQIADKIRDLAIELGPGKDWNSLIAAVDKRLQEIKSTIAAYQQEQAAFQSKLGGLQEQLRAAIASGKEAERLQAEIKELLSRQNLLNILGNQTNGAFSKGGIPALLIERATPDLEAAANEVLSTLSDGEMSLALRSQKAASKGKGFSETLDIIISAGRGERPYENFSGGEAMRVNLALRIGLARLLAARAGARCELLVTDEICAPLDAAGQDLFVECLGKVSNYFGMVLVISHLESLKDKFPWRFDITKDLDGSRVEISAR